jgi:hypothetical protein
MASELGRVDHPASSGVGPRTRHPQGSRWSRRCAGRGPGRSCRGRGGCHAFPMPRRHGRGAGRGAPVSRRTVLASDTSNARVSTCDRPATSSTDSRASCGGVVPHAHNGVGRPSDLRRCQEEAQEMGGGRGRPLVAGDGGDRLLMQALGLLVIQCRRNPGAHHSGCRFRQQDGWVPGAAGRGPPDLLWEAW